MNPAHLWIVAAILAGGIGTFLQAIGSARREGESEVTTRRRRVWLGLGTLLTAFAVYCLWTGQQQLMQQAAARPVLDISVDLDKRLFIKNLGTIDIEDLTVDATIYTLKGTRKGNHIAITGIESFSKLSVPIWTTSVLAKTGGVIQIDLRTTPVARLLPIYDGVPDPAEPEGRTVYCFRVLFRNGVTKQRFIRHAIVGPFKGFPDMYGDYRGAAFGGGYESSKKVFEMRDLLRSHQLSLFDDDPAALYRD